MTRILVVEDEAIVAMDIQDMLKSRGYDAPATASSGEEAIKKVAEIKPDLVLMDIVLKGEMDGIEAAGQIRNRFNIPVVYLTAHADNETLQRAKITEPFGYMLKPLEERELYSTIEIALYKHMMEEKLREYTKELERANRELKNYAHAISHDLRDPLYDIQTFIRFLMRDYADKLDEEGQNYLNMLRETSARIVKLIEDLLLLCRLGGQYTEVETVDLNALLGEIKTELRMQIEEGGGEVVVGKMPNIFTIKVWMKELFMNLISNGLKFNKSEKPRVEVSYEEREKEKDYLFKVKDNGIDIDEANLERIVDLFDTPQLEYGGVTVDLAISRKIVSEFGGTIWVESKPGEGATFYFTIPKLYQYFDTA